jgi:hypothetical protein
VNGWKPPTPPPQEDKPKQLLESQIKSIQEIDAFIAAKDENDLRNTFDFPDILKYNILMVKRGIAPAQGIFPKVVDGRDSFKRRASFRL